MAGSERAIRRRTPRAAPTRLMKESADAILQLTQAKYLDTLLQPRDALLVRMEEYAADRGHPIADPEVAQTMRVLLRAKGPKHHLELGTTIGNSLLFMRRRRGAAALV